MIIIFASIMKDNEEHTCLKKFEFLALNVILHNKEITMKQLVENLGVSTSRVTGIANLLVDEELVKRERNHADRRVVKLTLTKKGEKTVMDHHERRAKALTQLMELLTPEEQESLILILEKISKATI